MFIKLDYFIWFIENGTTISILMGLFALNWEELELTEGLLSLRPDEYFATCALLSSIYSISISNFIISNQKEEKGTRIELLFDDVLSVILGYALLVVIQPKLFK